MKTKFSFLLIPLVLACVGLLSTAHAVTPAPDGGYPGQNTAEGDDALFSLSGGSDNTAIGVQTLYSNTCGGSNTATGSEALFYNTTGNGNTANGAFALVSNITGDANTAIGAAALAINTSGSRNTADGYEALAINTIGSRNTANGYEALYSNTTGGDNTATGLTALYSNPTGIENTANGYDALYCNTSGRDNTATGIFALLANITGDGNTANGVEALRENTSGDDNTANGFEALRSNTTGVDNSANGNNALYSNTTGNSNTANGNAALYSNTTGSGNIALGVSAGSSLSTGDHNIDIGNPGVAGESNTIRIGRQGTQTTTYIAGIAGTGVSGRAVKINAAGQLGTPPSARRFKEEIKPMDKVSEAILALRPICFRYKKKIDPDRTPQFGLVAEEVEKVDPDLVARDAKGRIYTVRYDAVNAMLLNEFLKEHKKVQELKTTVARFESRFAQQEKQIEALTSGLQKVNAQFELSRSAPEMVATSRLGIGKRNGEWK